MDFDKIGIILFQSTLPRGSDRATLDLRCFSDYFNPRSLAGATAGYSKKTAGVQAFQSTLPRGSDLLSLPITSAVFISIHAPSRERPVELPLEQQKTLISIHAPSRERQLIQ